MIWLVLNILVSGLLYIIFRLFPKYKVDNLIAIIINYITAGLLGCLLMDNHPESIFQRDWFPTAAMMGLVFIFIFLLMASSSQVNGIANTSVANKMSLIIPVLAGIFLYSEVLNGWVILGIVLALLGVVLTSMKEKSQRPTTNGYFMLICIFIGSGMIDTVMKYMQANYLSDDESATFVMVIFLSAALFGLLYVLIAHSQKLRNFNKVSIIGGIALGIPNFCSIYFLIMALSKSGLQSSVLYPINNMGVVAMTAISGLILFKEKFSLVNIIGILAAVAAIALIAFGR